MSLLDRPLGRVKELPQKSPDPIPRPDKRNGSKNNETTEHGSPSLRLAVRHPLDGKDQPVGGIGDRTARRAAPRPLLRHPRPYVLLDLRLLVPDGDAQVVAGLQAHPELRRRTEVAR